CPPNSNWTPASRSCAGISPSSLSDRVSDAVTRALCRAQNKAVATPVRASPTTSTRLPRNSIDPGISISKNATAICRAFFPRSPQLQRRQRKQRKHQRGNPETHNHFALAPAHQLKMMMNGRHAKNALATQLEGADLQNHRERFQHKNATYKHKQNFLLDNHRD